MNKIAFPKPTKKKKRINLLPKEKTRSQIIKELDKVVSLIVRTKAGWECQKCHVIIPPPTNMMQCSHFWKREIKGTRWDFDNLDSLCWSCHQGVEKQKQGWYRDYMLKKLGERGYQILEVKANTTTKYPTKDLEILLQVFESQL